MSFKNCVLAATFVFSSHLAGAQGVRPLDGTYTYGAIGGLFDDSCHAADSLELQGERGTFTFNPNGTFQQFATRRIVCDDMTAFTFSESAGGTYQLHGDGKLVLDFNPAMPGVELLNLRISFDHEVFMFGENSFAPLQLLALKQTQNLTNADFIGDYQTGTFNQDLNTVNPFPWVEGCTEFVEFKVQNNGAWTATGIEKCISAIFGMSTSSVVASGRHVVMPNGEFSVTGGAPTGALSADGNIAFSMSWENTEATFTVLVRKGAAYSATALEGEWRTGGTTIMPAGQVVSAVHGATHFDANLGTCAPGAWGSSWTSLGVAVAANLTSIGSGSASAGGCSSSNADGSFRTQANGSALVLSGWLAASETFGFTVDVTSSDKLTLNLMQRRCSPPVSYGTSTAGTGGVAPVLSSSGGFPTLGNASLAFQVAQGRGGAPAVMAHTLGPFPGVPALGGRIWIDPSSLVRTDVILLGGTAGVAGVGQGQFAAPVSSSPSIVGTDVYSQVLVIDSTAPAGFSMTQAMAWQICE